MLRQPLWEADGAGGADGGQLSVSSPIAESSSTEGSTGSLETAPKPSSVKQAAEAFRQFLAAQQQLASKETASSSQQDSFSDGQAEKAPKSTEQPEEELDFAGRKVKVTDPIIRELHRDYMNLNSAFTQASQRAAQAELKASQLEAELRQIRETVEAIRQSQQAEKLKTEEDKPSISPERLQEINEQFLEKFYDDPLGAHIWLMEQPEYQQLIRPRLSPQVETVLTEAQRREMERQQQAARIRETMESRYPDFREMLPSMQKVLERYPHFAEQIATNPTPEVIESVYWIAKGMIQATQQASEQAGIQQQTTSSISTTDLSGKAQMAEPKKAELDLQALADQLAQNQEFLAKIASNPQLQQIVISNYVKSVQNAQASVPITIGPEAGGQVPMTPPQKISNLRDATNAFRSFLSRMKTS